MDYARTRLAMDSAGSSANRKRQYNRLFDVYRKTLESDGIRGLYRGFGISIVGITMYRGMYFGLYDSLKPIVLIGPFKVRFVYAFLKKFQFFFCLCFVFLTYGNNLQENFVASFFLGWSVTTCSGFCAYPFDTLRRRMMLTSGQPIKYRNGIHALCEIIRLEGFWALYRGVTANMLVGVAGAGVLAGYDKLCQITYKS